MPKKYVPKGISTANMLMSGGRPATGSRPLRNPFITIAHQVGAECFSLPKRLTQFLSAADPRGPIWSHWDQELVEKVSQSSNIPADVVTSFETSGHSWVDDLLTGISGRTDEMVVFHGIKQVIRDLAQTGHVVLIGHGSVYMTRDIPGGVHVRLIAPLALRIRNVAARFGLSPDQGARHMRRLDRQRAAFFRRFWPDRRLSPEMFAATLNIEELDEERLTRALLSMLATNAMS